MTVSSGKKSHGVEKGGHSKKMSMKRANKGTPSAQQQRENWVTMNKSTLVNLVDVLVGPGLSSSGDEDDEPRLPSRDTDSGKCAVTDQKDTIYQKADQNIVHKSRTVSKDYTSMMTASGPFRSQLQPPQTPLAKQAPTRKAATPDKPGGRTSTANKQVLKQCWVALNKTVVFDMVELAMGGSPNHEDKDQPEGARYGGDGDVDSRSIGGCDGDCSENSTDSMCSIHGPHQDQQQPSGPSSATKARAVRKRGPDCIEVIDKVSLSRKRTKRVETRGLSYRPEVRMLAPERPASAPVEASPIHPSLRGPGRAPSPHSKEYNVLRRVHASECERLMSWAKQCARNQHHGTPGPSTNSTQSDDPHQAPAAQQGSRDSPKLGWVAVSKAHVHTIMDNVMSAMILDPGEEDRQQEKTNLSHSPSPSPPPPHLIKQVPSPVIPQEPCSAPHRPWLDSEPTPASHSNSASSSSSASSQASSPPPSHETGSSPNNKGPAAALKAFKWKSRVLLRCQGSPERESMSDEEVSRKAPSPPEVTHSPGKSDSRKPRRKRRHHNKSKQ